MRFRSAPGGPRLWLLSLLVIALLGGSDFWETPGSGSAVSMTQRRDESQPVASTPVATRPEPDDPLDGDPLDGDPGDGDPFGGDSPGKDSGAPEDLAALPIERSGRPSQEPHSSSAYDDNLATVWQPDATNGETWVWFDLGTEQRVREVRWLAEGPGAVEVSVSSDRRRWEAVEQVDADGEWQSAVFREDARYVRLTLLPDADEAPLALAEVAIYGRGGGGSIAVEQEVDQDRDQGRDRSGRDDRTDPRDDAAANDPGSGAGDGNDRTHRRGGRVQISTAPGETRCEGERERCRARQGEVSVEEDCTAEGTCTIDIRADGGTAICDAAGGDGSRAGRGEGRRGADGGECEAVANGGAVAIGDINP